MARVLEHASATNLVDYVLKHHDKPSTIVVCGTQDGFLQQLTTASSHAADQRGVQSAQHDNDSQGDGLDEALVPPIKQSWAVPTLRLLATSRTVKVAFCPDITHLRAYLATFIAQANGSAVGGRRILAILDPITLHRPTSAFSAQGLNRTFSIAIEAAYRTGSTLVVAETHMSATPVAPEEDPGLTDGIVPAKHPATADVWDEEVSILNVTTKSFGAGERGWVGRTVKLRTIAERWFRFEDLRAA